MRVRAPFRRAEKGREAPAEASSCSARPARTTQTKILDRSPSDRLSVRPSLNAKAPSPQAEKGGFASENLGKLLDIRLVEGEGSAIARSHPCRSYIAHAAGVDRRAGGARRLAKR